MLGLDMTAPAPLPDRRPVRLRPLLQAERNAIRRLVREIVRVQRMKPKQEVKEP